MISFCLLILCLNINAFSYGVAYGAKKVKLKLPYITSLSILSTLLFLIPLYFSKYIYQYFNKRLCEVLNGIILIILGLSYLKPKKEQQKNTPQTNNSSLKKLFLECFAFSVDAIFTAFLSGFSGNFFLFFVFFYFFTNFLSIFCGNLFSYKIGSKTTKNLSFFSFFIFFFLGLFKIMGF